MTAGELRNGSLPSGTEFEGLFLLRKVSAKTSRTDTPYLSLEVGDRSGSFSFTLFQDHPAFETLRSTAEGQVLRLKGKVDAYQNRFAPRVGEITVIPPDQLGLVSADHLVESSPEDRASLWAEILRFLDQLQPAELAATVRGVLDEVGDRFRESPAASSMHHAYRCGLLEHTVHIARAAEAVLPIYPEVDRNLAIAGILLHDVGKALEFEPGLSPKRGRTGQLNGHVVLGYRLARKHGLIARLDADLLERLEHIILSHQGELEWGAAVMAATPEAVFVSILDNLDAKMGMVQRALRNRSPQAEFSDYLPGLKSSVLLKPTRLEEAPDEPAEA